MDNAARRHEIPPPSERHTKPGYWVSLAAHGSMLILLIAGGRHVWKARPIAMRGGSHTAVLVWDGLASTNTAKSLPQHAKIQPKLQENPKLAMKTPEQKTESKPQLIKSAGNSPTQSLQVGQGSSDQNLTPAFPTFSPNPPIGDRSLLPQSETNVVVDVNVSAQGEVMGEKLIQGLGNNLDQIILDTVKSWKFHPATLDGNAIDSVSELVFPMSQRYQG
jgi:hypothetical protein